MFQKKLVLSIISLCGFVPSFSFAGGGSHTPPYCEQAKLPIIKLQGCTISSVDLQDSAAAAIDPKAQQALQDLVQVGNSFDSMGCVSPKGIHVQQYGLITTAVHTAYPVYSYDNETILNYVIKSGYGTLDHFPLVTDILMKFEKPNKLVFTEHVVESLNPFKTAELTVATVTCEE